MLLKGRLRRRRRVRVRVKMRVTLVIITALVDFIPLTVSVISAVVTDLCQWPPDLKKN